MKRLLLTLSMALVTSVVQCDSFDKTTEKEVLFEDGCTIEKCSFFSSSMSCNIRIVVVLPPAYEASSGKLFPILYTLHGYGAPYETWSKMKTMRQALTECPMIVTCFDGDKGAWYLDSPVRADSQFETFFFNEFIPYLNDTYRVDPDRSAVTGFSMGGSGAFQYMLAKPKQFRSVSSLSGAFYELTPPNEKMRGYLKSLIGTYEENPEGYKALDTTQGVRNATILPPVYLHCGTEDFLLEENRKMNALLKKKGFSVEYRESKGAHNWAFWKAAAPEIVKFHWKNGLAD